MRRECLFGKEVRVARGDDAVDGEHSRVMVIRMQSVRMPRVVTEHDIGALYRPGDTSSFVAAVRDVQQRYDHPLANVSAARSALSWQTDAQALLAVYAGLPAASAR